MHASNVPGSNVPGNNAISIRGQGVAACCCAQLLGVAPVEPPGRARIPAIMVSAATQALIADVFQREAVFDSLPQIDTRVVAWGPGAEPRALPHSAIVISEQELVQRLQPAVPANPQCAAWTIYSSRPLPIEAEDHHYGSRIASALSVTLKPDALPKACWIESLESGWLFLLPARDGAWLLAVGGDAATLLSGSVLIARQIDTLQPGASSFPAHPRMADPLCGPGWLACGSAAMAFDPLCGDGVGNAIREAILACAVIRAALDTGDTDVLLAHYRARLLSGFRRHLELCLDFYRTGGTGPWWAQQVHGIQSGLQWCAREMHGFTGFRYRLTNFELSALP